MQWQQQISGTAEQRTLIERLLRISLLLRVGAALLLTAGAAMGQQNGSAADTGRRPDVTADASQASGVESQVGGDPVRSSMSGELLLRTNSGELVPLRQLLGIDYRSIVDELLNRGQQQLVVPRFEVARLELSGEVERDVVTLSAELTIRVQQDHEWVTVPVAFSDLHIDDISHTAESAHARAIPETSDPAQKRWHLYGAGLHTIQLRLIGKTRPQTPAGHALNLNLPRATISHAKIRFASPVELQKLPPDSVERTVADETGVREAEFWGLTPSFSLSWVEVVAQVSRRPVIQVQSNRMKLDLNSIPVALTGIQTLQISGSPVNELTVLFPQGFLLLEVSALNQSGASVLSGFEVTSVQNGSSAVVRLAGPMEGLLTLNFEMELLNRAFPQDVQVRLPIVGTASTQSGDLDIMIPPGLRVQQTRVEGAQRKRVTSETDASVQATAFRLRSVDSVVVLHVEEIQAQYAVSPEVDFEPNADNVLMTARFPVNVLTGSLLDVNIRWPGYSGGIWQLLPGTTFLISEKQNRPLSLEQAADDANSFKLTFPERQSGQFRVEFRAFAPAAALRSAGATLTCPVIESREQEPVIITTVESDTYSLQPINSETSRSLQTAPFQSAAIAQAMEQGRNAQAWLHVQPEVPLTFELVRQAPSVTTSMSVGLTPRDAGIEVRQEILFQIEHSELAVLSFIVPEGVQPAVTIAGESERLRASLDSPTSWSFRLPTSRRGRIRVYVDYLWQVRTDEVRDSLQLELPLVLPLPQSSDMTRCEVGASVASGLRVKDEQNWSPVFSDRFEAAWLISGPASSVPIEWQRSVLLNPDDSPMFLMSRTRVTMTEAVTTTLAVFEKSPGQIRFRLPTGVKPESITFNGRSLRELDGKAYTATEDASVRWTIALRSDLQRQEPALTGSGIRNPSTNISEGSAVIDTSDGVLMEIQTRERTDAVSSLYQSASFHRPEFETMELAIPSIWVFESHDNFRVVSRKALQTSLTGFRESLLRSTSHVNTLEARIDAVLSPYPAKMRSRLSERVNEWMTTEHRQDAFFALSDSGPLSVYLIPTVSLLLVSATTCVIFFGLMCGLRLPSLAVPILFVVSAVPAMYLAWPEWTVMLTPYVIVGIVFGIVSLTFQRLSSDRQLRFPGRGRTGEMLTVFGYSGFLSGSSSVVRSDSVVSTGSEISASAGR